MPARESCVAKCLTGCQVEPRAGSWRAHLLNAGYGAIVNRLSDA